MDGKKNPFVGLSTFLKRLKKIHPKCGNIVVYQSSTSCNYGASDFMMYGD
jgi:hypothetical protein